MWKYYVCSCDGMLTINERCSNKDINGILLYLYCSDFQLTFVWIEYFELELVCHVI